MSGAELGNPDNVRINDLDRSTMVHVTSEGAIKVSGLRKWLDTMKVAGKAKYNPQLEYLLCVDTKTNECYEIRKIRSNTQDFARS